MHVAVPRTHNGAAEALAARLHGALDGSGPAVAPYAADAALAADPSDAAHGAHAAVREQPRPARVPQGVALVVRTSGSTGAARGVMLDAAALVASAQATHERLAGPGRWLLALPMTHVAGLQVLVRSLVAGTTPLVLDTGDGFDPAALCALADEHRRDADRADEPLYTSLVPTQVHRLLAWAEEAPRTSLDPLRHLSALLLGGAASSPALLARAREAGLPVVTTYGMTETSGGCVSDGVPLAGVRVEVARGGNPGAGGPTTDRTGVIRLSGPVLARGYVDCRDEAFATDDSGTRWFTTQDLGVVDGGLLTVLGRRDDFIVTGGENVAPAAVEAVVAGVPGVGQACVVGLPDAEWGQVVVAVIVPARAGGAGVPTLADVRAAVTRTLWSAAAPRHLVVLDALPQRGPGKVDRAEVARRAAAAV